MLMDGTRYQEKGNGLRKRITGHYVRCMNTDRTAFTSPRIKGELPTSCSSSQGQGVFVSNVPMTVVGQS
jgi:hypothetical protein